jgi:hypothetical protein
MYIIIDRRRAIAKEEEKHMTSLKQNTQKGARYVEERDRETAEKREDHIQMEKNLSPSWHTLCFHLLRHASWKHWYQENRVYNADEFLMSFQSSPLWKKKNEALELIFEVKKPGGKGK